MGSDRDYGTKSSADRTNSREARMARIAEDRKSAIHALDLAGRMTKEDAARIQSHADRTGRNEDFKERAMSSAARNADDDEQ